MSDIGNLNKTSDRYIDLDILNGLIRDGIINAHELNHGWLSRRGLEIKSNGFVGRI